MESQAERREVELSTTVRGCTHAGRFTCRLRMMSSDLLLSKSVSVPSGNEEMCGLVQRARRAESACKQPSKKRRRGVTTPAITKLLHSGKVSVFEHKHTVNDV